MPIYEYQCSACGHRLEALQKISEEPLVYCPECNDPALKKQISAAAFRLKGTGWYETDFKGGNKDDKKDDKKSDSKAGDKSGDSTSTGLGDSKSSSPSKDAASKPADASSASA